MTNYFSLFFGKASKKFTCPALFLPVLDSKQTVISKIAGFPSEKCLKFLLVRLYFYLSRTGGQSVISMPVL